MDQLNPTRQQVTLVSALTLVLFLLGACAPTQPTKPEPVQVAPSQNAYNHLQQGNWNAAAYEFLRLAETTGGDKASDFRLRAAEAFANDGQMEMAEKLVASLANFSGSTEFSMRRDLLRAEFLLNRGELDEAVETLNGIRPSAIPDYRKLNFWRARAEVFIDLGQYLEAASERVKLESQLRSTEEREANHQAIWAALGKVHPDTLARSASSPPDALSGWIELQLATQTHLHEADAFVANLDNWRRRYPSHAGQQFANELAEISATFTQTPSKVALLLPLEGKFAGAAQAVRDGYLAAWYDDYTNARRPSVTTYNANAANIGATYARAVNDGAELVIGPLEKSAVEALASNLPLPVVTVVLNEVSTKAGVGQSNDPGLGAHSTPQAPAIGSKLFQFGLQPEEEAKQVAERAWSDGHRLALTIAPEGTWGERVQHAFTEHWLQLGGVVLEQQSYAQQTNDFGSPIQALLNVDASRTRARELRDLLRNDLKSETRRRQDADFIFMAAFPVHARQLRPQLNFHHAVDLPVYTTSHAYVGTPNKERDRDLNGVIVGDMPWVLRAGRQEDPLFQSVSRNWDKDFQSYARLFALGIDAYRIVPHLGRLKVQRFGMLNGVTGVLSMDDHRVMRQLDWAKFVDGVPVPMGDSDLLQ